MHLSDTQCLNNMLGIPGFLIIAPGTTWIGSFTAFRLVQTDGITIDGIDLSPINEEWIVAEYIYGSFSTIENNSAYYVLAYLSGETQAVEQ